MQINSPFHLDDHGQVALADENLHIRQMIEQVLFTSPGERVNRPDFGCGIEALVFEAMNAEMVSVTQALIQGGLQRWLGDVIHIEKVTTAAVEDMLDIVIVYRPVRGGAQRVERFRR